jgi:hypothetical protein
MIASNVLFLVAGLMTALHFSGKEIENKKTQVKSTDDFNKDVEDGFTKEKDRLEKLRKSIEERFLIK